MIFCTIPGKTEVLFSFGWIEIMFFLSNNVVHCYHKNMIVAVFVNNFPIQNHTTILNYYDYENNVYLNS